MKNTTKNGMNNQVGLNVNNKTKGHIALIIAGLIFGANYAIAKGLMPVHFQPLQIIFLRVLGAAVLFFVLSLFIKKEKFSKKDMLTIAFASMLGIAINQIMFFLGLNLTTPVNASIIHASSPILIIIFSATILHEKITWFKVSGIAFGAAGTLLLILYQNPVSINSSSFKGNLFILINIAAYTLYLVIIKPVMIKYHPINIMKWVFFFGFLWVAPFTFSSLSSLQLENIPADIWLSLFYVIVGTTCLAYLLTTYGLRYLNASVVGYYIYMQPLVAALIAWILLDEKITILKILATLLIFTGVFLVSGKFKKT